MVFNGTETVSYTHLDVYKRQQGVQGETGPTGMQGEKGDRGVAGLTGPTGEAGPQGEAGPTGPTGATGAIGPRPNIYIGNVEMADYADVDSRETPDGVLFDFVVPKGDTGPTGPQGLAGATGPQGESFIASATELTGQTEYEFQSRTNFGRVIAFESTLFVHNATAIEDRGYITVDVDGIYEIYLNIFTQVETGFYNTFFIASDMQGHLHRYDSNLTDGAVHRHVISCLASLSAGEAISASCKVDYSIENKTTTVGYRELIIKRIG